MVSGMQCALVIKLIGFSGDCFIVFRHIFLTLNIDIRPFLQYRTYNIEEISHWVEMDVGRLIENAKPLTLDLVCSLDLHM